MKTAEKIGWILFATGAILTFTSFKAKEEKAEILTPISLALTGIGGLWIITSQNEYKK